MRIRLPASRNALPDALELVAYLGLFFLTAFIIWLWSKAGVPLEVEVAGYIAGSFGLVGLSFLCAEQDIKLFRRMRSQLRRTFPKGKRKRPENAPEPSEVERDLL